MVVGAVELGFRGALVWVVDLFLRGKALHIYDGESLIFEGVIARIEERCDMRGNPFLYAIAWSAYNDWRSVQVSHLKRCHVSKAWICRQ